MPAECQHAQPVCVASAARLYTEHGYMVGQLQWCADCGAIRTHIEAEFGVWNLPGEADTLDAVADLRARELLKTRSRMQVLPGGTQ